MKIAESGSTSDLKVIGNFDQNDANAAARELLDAR